jgi:hypothetical protein
MSMTYRINKGALELRPVVGVRLEKGEAFLDIGDGLVPLVVGEWTLCGARGGSVMAPRRAQVMVEYIDEAANQWEGNINYFDTVAHYGTDPENWPESGMPD